METLLHGSIGMEKSHRFQLTLRFIQKLEICWTTAFGQRLIKARKVIGGHGGPPCETYTCARWNQIEGIICPQPLRDAEMPWGRLFLSLKEVQQLFMGNLLMLTTLKLLLLIHIYGGSTSMEHPKGDSEDERKWAIWQAAFIRWMLLDGQIHTVTFLQGPLGRDYAKPTTMMIGRMPWFSSMIFSHYQKHWRATEVLGGRDGTKWRTSKAKEYPIILSKIIAQSHLAHWSTCRTEGLEVEPEGLHSALSKLSNLHDPYDPNALGTTMKADYHARKF